MAVAARQLADRRRLAGAVDADHEDHGGQLRSGGLGPPVVRTARDEEGRELGADGGLGAARIVPAPRLLDDVHRQAGTDVTGNEGLLNVVPGRSAGSAAEEAAEPADEAGPALLQTGDEVA